VLFTVFLDLSGENRDRADHSSLRPLSGDSVESNRAQGRQGGPAVARGTPGRGSGLAQGKEGGSDDVNWPRCRALIFGC